MSLRSLSAGYLILAFVFGILATRHDHPDWASMTDRLVLEWRDRALTQIADATDRIFPGEKPGPSKPEMRKPPPRAPLPSDKRYEDPHPIAVAPAPLEAPEVAELPQKLPDVSVPQFRVAEEKNPVVGKPALVAESKTKPREPVVAELPPPPPRTTPLPNPAQIARVRERLDLNLTKELSENFDLFLYVSKAERGPWAQNMYVFGRQKSGELKSLYAWPVSTGREKVEYNSRGDRLPSYTPAGYYQLDPARSYRKYRSMQWGQNMPYAMFFTWIKDGYQTGLAIHGAEGADVALLGSRASAGCVRLSPENAAFLYNLIRKNYRGPAPKFAYDKRTATMSNEGMLMRDKQGNLVFTEGYKVLVYIENNGGQDVVAALY